MRKQAIYYFIKLNLRKRNTVFSLPNIHVVDEDPIHTVHVDVIELACSVRIGEIIYWLSSCFASLWTEPKKFLL